MLGAYIATHLSIMLENFEVASFLKQYRRSFRTDMLALFCIYLCSSTSAKKWMKKSTELLPVKVSKFQNLFFGIVRGKSARYVHCNPQL